MPKSVGAPTVKLDHVRSPPGYVTLMLRPFLMRSAGIVPVHAVVEYGSPSNADPALSSPYVPGICEGGLSAISTSSEPRSSFVTCIDTAEDSASEPSSNIVSASRLPTRCRSMSPYRDSPAVSHVRAGAGKTCDCASSSVTWADPDTSEQDAENGAEDDPRRHGGRYRPHSALQGRAHTIGESPGGRWRCRRPRDLA